MLITKTTHKQLKLVVDECVHLAMVIHHDEPVIGRGYRVEECLLVEFDDPRLDAIFQAELARVRRGTEGE